MLDYKNIIIKHYALSLSGSEFVVFRRSKQGRLFSSSWYIYNTINQSVSQVTHSHH